MTSKLWACLSIFQEADHIERTLQAANQWAEGFIVLDGAYKTFPDAGDGPSTDGTLEIVEQFKESTTGTRPFIVESHLWENQVQKRNRYLELIPDEDWVMVVDGDFRTVFYGNGFKEYEENLVKHEWDAYQGRVIMIRDGVPFDYHWGNPFLFRKVPGLHYKYNHYSLYDEFERLFYLPPYKIKPLGLMILEAPRTADHTKRIRDYQMDRQDEQSNGMEQLVCGKCKCKVNLLEGDLMKCPFCGAGGLASPVVHKVPKQFSMIKLREH